MLQKQHSQMGSVSTPDEIQMQRTKTYPSIVEVSHTLIMDTLMRQYRRYRKNQIRRGVLSRALSRFWEFCAATFEVCTQIWRQIIPEQIRGDLESDSSSPQLNLQDKEQKCFEQFSKKKARFFVIVYDDQSSEDEIQEAFQKASFIATDGRAITIEQLVRETNCPAWNIKNWSRTKRYSILFFKFDVFGQLLYFGNLTKEMIDANLQEEHYFDHFKEELVAAYQHYQIVEREFVNSYLEKEERLELQLE